MITSISISEPGAHCKLKFLKMSGKKDPREQDPLDPENDLFWDPDLLRQPPPPPPPAQEYIHTI